jgi:putative ABC transport system permease protein
MRAAWRLGISALSGRRSRTVLLIGAVALSAALVAAVACAIGSLNETIRAQLDRQLGTAESRISPVGTAPIGASVLELAASWEGVEAATGRASSVQTLTAVLSVLEQDGGAWTRRERTAAVGAEVLGVDPATEFGEDRVELVAGRAPAADDEIVLDGLVAGRMSGVGVLGGGNDTPRSPFDALRAEYLDFPRPEVPASAADSARARAVNIAVGVRPGDVVRVPRLLRLPTELKVVGIAAAPPLGGKPRAWMTTAGLWKLTGEPDRYQTIELDLAEGIDAEAFVERHGEELGERLLLQTTQRVTSGVEKNMASGQLGFVLATVLAFLSAAFIITTGLTTGVAEQQRALATLRCIGAERRQLAGAQLVVGLLVGGIGTAIGVPLGIALAWTVVTVFREQVPEGLTLPPVTLTLAAVGSTLSGVGGALWPAWRAARTSPLEGLRPRAKAASTRGLAITTLVGAAAVLFTGVVVAVPSDAQAKFWAYATVGLPAMFVGYFLLSVGAVAGMNALLAGPLTRAFALPPRILRRSVAGTPYRHGFTAGAMMAGLALMIALWTNGGSVLRDWLGKMAFPDAFAYGVFGPGAAEELDKLDFVRSTCAITIHPVRTDAFGVRALQRYQTSFIAFEPEPFLRMTTLDWIEGSAEEALPRLEAGGAVLVAREFRIAQGMGVGDVFVCQDARGNEQRFDIVGVVTSPGLEFVSQFFDLGDNLVNQAVHSVFGSRRDLIERFGVESAQLLQVELDPAVSDEVALPAMRDALLGRGVLNVGSGREVREQIVAAVGGSLVVFSAVAVGSMLVACFGVANLVIAGIQARRFEFGVLRAVGAMPGMLTRMVLAEAVIIAAGAMVTGTALGIQGAWAGQELHRGLMGIDMTLRPPAGPILMGWAFVAGLTVLAAWPAARRLGREPARELLAGARG